jgi:RNA polymerase sigma-70 factor (ECF subfamily)
VDAAVARQVFEDHHRWVWGLGYRMLGVPADADDVVQTTFERVLHRPPPDQTRAWTPWIMKVATRVAIDRLRARKARAAYVGPWLPGPVGADREHVLHAAPARDPAAEYELAESATLAFLLALEALTPTQRAVLILRHVFDLSVAETAQALDLSASNVKVSAHRARARMADMPHRSASAATVGMQTFALFQAVRSGELGQVMALLAPDAQAMTDSNGVYSAARRPVLGAEAVAKFFIGIQRFAGRVKVQVVQVNGLPAMLVERSADARFAPRSLIQVVLDGQGRISRILTVQAPSKLAGVG